MEIEKPTEQPDWFSLPLHQSARATVPLYLAGLGSLCWEAAALWGDPSAPLLNRIWTALVLVGLVFMSLGFFGGIAYSRYKAAGLAIILAVISPFVWFYLCFALHPLFEKQPDGFPVVLWLYFQFPVALIALWRGHWQRRVQVGATALAAVGMVCLFTMHAIRASQEVVGAPRVSDQYLSLVYQKNDISVIKGLENKRIIVMGIVGDRSGGLIGGGPPIMQGNIRFDDLGPFNSVGDGQNVSIFGTCKGKDAQGTIHLVDCRTVN